MVPKKDASMESKQTCYILHTRYSNSKIGIDLLYIRTHFVWWHRLHYRATLVCNLPTSILVNAWVRFMTYSSSDNMTPRIYRVLIGRHWFFAHWRHQRAATRLQDVRQLNVSRCKKLSFQLIPEPFHFHTVLLTRLHGRSCRTTSQIFRSILKKKDICKY